MQPKLFSVLKSTGENRNVCRAHGIHQRKNVQILLSGRFRELPDLPHIPKNLSQTFPMTIFDYKKYQDTNGYCTGDDAISLSLDLQGVWEGIETLLILDILHKGNKQNVVLDFGSHIGWYTILAARAGYKVAAFDTDAENTAVLIHNAEINHVQERVFPYQMWVDERAPMLRSTGESVELMKCDIEGNEKYAVEMCHSLFKNRKINYAMLEISPVFNDGYTELCLEIARAGYRVFMVPRKGDPVLVEMSDAVSPLDVLVRNCEIPLKQIGKTVRSIKQEDFLFINRDLL